MGYGNGEKPVKSRIVVDRLIQRIFYVPHFCRGLGWTVPYTSRIPFEGALSRDALGVDRVNMPSEKLSLTFYDARLWRTMRIRDSFNFLERTYSQQDCRARLAMVILPPTTLWFAPLFLPLFSAAIVRRFSCNCTSLSSAFCHPFHIYIEALLPYKID